MLQAFFQQHGDKAFSFKQIFHGLHIDSHQAKMLAVETVEDMVWDDYLIKTTDNTYRLNLKGQIQEGVFIRKNNGRNSFVPDGGEEPVFVAERNSKFALTGDRVRVSLMARKRNHIKEAMVTEILERKKDCFVGKLSVERDFAFLIIQHEGFSHDIIIPKKQLKGGKTGDKAVVQITKWPDEENKNVMGKVIDVLGKEGDNDVEMHAILAKFNLPYKYPKAVEQAAEKLPVEITKEDIAEREDFRSTFTCTIDPKDAKDFDDALSIKPLDKGLWQVGVHIADVSHYVKEGSLIDKEAQKRATSVYLVDRTIPMLPERLCNFICSLRQDEDKLCYSVIFNMNDRATVLSYRITRTIIRSNRRFAYEEVQEILEQNGVKDSTGEPAPEKPKTGYKGEWAEELITLDRLAKLLRKKRFKEGSVKFDREELHFDVDDKGKPTRCYYKKSKDANKLIEEFMLLANRTVAESVGKVRAKQKAKTLVYRIHDMPDATKLEKLREFILKFGYKIRTEGSKGEISSSLNALMDEVSGRPEQKAVESVALRAMMKARYSVHNIGHYGLNFPYYTHFTSPIRRYPDTMVHRILTHYAEGGRSVSEKKYEALSEHSSDMEQVAQQAERESIKYKMVEFMGQFVGDEFDAHISGITSYGIYCEVDDNHCEGMVPLHDLDDDYYDFDERNFCLVGRRRHKKYQLGDAVRIQVARADVEKRQLDFVLAK